MNDKALKIILAILAVVLVIITAIGTKLFLFKNVNKEDVAPTEISSNHESEKVSNEAVNASINTTTNTVEKDFAVKCTYDNYGTFDYVIGVANTDSIYIKFFDTDHKKTYNIRRADDAYRFTTNNTIREIWWNLDRKTAILTSKIQGAEFLDATPKSCLTISVQERNEVLNEILNKIKQEEDARNSSIAEKQRKIDEYNNKKPQF